MAWLLAKTAFGRSFYATGDIYRALVNWAFVRKPFALWHFVERLHGGTGGNCVCFADWFYPNQTGTGLEMKAIAACVLGVLVCSAVPVRSSVRYSAHGSDADR